MMDDGIMAQQMLWEGLIPPGSLSAVHILIGDGVVSGSGFCALLRERLSVDFDCKFKLAFMHQAHAPGSCSRSAHRAGSLSALRVLLLPA